MRPTTALLGALVALAAVNATPLPPVERAPTTGLDGAASIGADGAHAALGAEIGKLKAEVQAALNHNGLAGAFDIDLGHLLDALDNLHLKKRETENEVRDSPLDGLPDIGGLQGLLKAVEDLLRQLLGGLPVPLPSGVVPRDSPVDGVAGAVTGGLSNLGPLQGVLKAVTDLLQKLLGGLPVSVPGGVVPRDTSLEDLTGPVPGLDPIQGVLKTIQDLLAQLLGGLPIQGVVPRDSPVDAVTGALPGVGGLQDVLKGLAEVIDQLLGTDLLRQIPGTDVQYPSPEYDGLPGPGSASRRDNSPRDAVPGADAVGGLIQLVQNLLQALLGGLPLPVPTGLPLPTGLPIPTGVPTGIPDEPSLLGLGGGMKRRDDSPLGTVTGPLSDIGGLQGLVKELEDLIKQLLGGKLPVQVPGGVLPRDSPLGDLTGGLTGGLPGGLTGGTAGVDGLGGLLKTVQNLLQQLLGGLGGLNRRQLPTDLPLGPLQGLVKEIEDLLQSLLNGLPVDVPGGVLPRDSPLGGLTGGLAGGLTGGTTDGVAGLLKSVQDVLQELLDGLGLGLAPTPTPTGNAATASPTAGLHRRQLPTDLPLGPLQGLVKEIEDLLQAILGGLPLPPVGIPTPTATGEGHIPSPTAGSGFQLHSRQLPTDITQNLGPLQGLVKEIETLVKFLIEGLPSSVLKQANPNPKRSRRQLPATDGGGSTDTLPVLGDLPDLGGLQGLVKEIEDLLKEILGGLPVDVPGGVLPRDSPLGGLTGSLGGGGSGAALGGLGDALGNLLDTLQKLVQGLLGGLPVGVPTPAVPVPNPSASFGERTLNTRQLPTDLPLGPLQGLVKEIEDLLQSLLGGVVPTPTDLHPPTSTPTFSGGWDSLHRRQSPGPGTVAEVFKGGNVPGIQLLDELRTILNNLLSSLGLNAGDLLPRDPPAALPVDVTSALAPLLAKLLGLLGGLPLPGGILPRDGAPLDTNVVDQILKALEDLVDQLLNGLGGLIPPEAAGAVGGLADSVTSNLPIVGQRDIADLD